MKIETNVIKPEIKFLENDIIFRCLQWLANSCKIFKELSSEPSLIKI